MEEENTEVKRKGRCSKMVNFKEGDLIKDINPECDPGAKFGMVYLIPDASKDTVLAYWGASIKEAIYNYENKEGNHGHTTKENVRLYHPRSWKERIEGQTNAEPKKIPRR